MEGFAVRFPGCSRSAPNLELESLLPTVLESARMVNWNTLRDHRTILEHFTFIVPTLLAML